MKTLLQSVFPILLLLLPVAVPAAPNAMEGRWRLDPARSSALDGWTAWELVISVANDQVSLQHDMQWRSTKRSATNTVNTHEPTVLPSYFRVEQRHMALYPEKGGSTPVRAEWIDQGRTLRVEAEPPIETSQGKATIRIYGEYRLLEGGNDLLLIELHHSRPRPLVYRFSRVADPK